VNDHPESEQRKDTDRHVVGRAANQTAQRVTEEEADDRHRHLETRHQETDPEALPGL